MVTTSDLAVGTAPPPPVPAQVVALSPSRAGDFLTCPLLYRFRVVDRLPERPSLAATRGTLVHAVLERLFELPASERTVERATALLRPEWERLLAAEPEVGALFAAAAAGGDAAIEDSEDGQAGQAGQAGKGGEGGEDGADLDGWLAGAAELLERYFTLEDPTRLEPAERELYVETKLDAGVLLRGYVDRLDVAADGAMRVVDYKASAAPAVGFEARAMFQLRFYALVLWRLHGRVPRLLQLLYLGRGEVLRYEPDEADLRATERKVVALWQAIQRAAATGDWRPNPSRLCEWCDHQPLCPAFGGTPPPLPAMTGSADADAGDELPSPRTPDAAV